MPVKIEAALGATRRLVDLVSRVVVARHIKHWDVKNRLEKFQIGVRQIATPDDHANIGISFFDCGGIQAINDLIADCQDFHDILGVR